MPKLAKKRPVTIEYVQAIPLYLIELLDWCPDSYVSENLGIFIRTLEGDMHVSPGDYVIKGVQGEFYPCKPDIFKATYEDVV